MSSITSTPTASAEPDPSLFPSNAPDDNNDMNLGQPFSFTIIPLAIIAVAAVATLFICVRRRRKHGLNWTGISDADIERANRNTATRRPGGRNGRNWAVWRTDNLGLNEHGEAPPAYEPKARPGESLETGLPTRGDTTAAMHNSYELENMRRPDGSSSASSSPIATPAQTHPPAATNASADPPPPEYDSVTAGSTPPPPSTPHPGTQGGASSTTSPPLITAPPPAVSLWGRRG